MIKAIDLRSDTLTKITKNDVLDLDFTKIGDDCYGEDYYVKELEDYCSDLFGKESALFMPSGTMSNQIGLRCLGSHGDEIITEVGYHINFFESSQVSAMSGLVLNAYYTQNGILTSEDVIAAIDAKARWSSLYARNKIVSIESSINTYGGMVYPVDEMHKMRALCNERGMSLYLDGARVLNTCSRLDLSPDKYVAPADMLNFCFSKGLGAPFGSILLGTSEHIAQARIFRKWYGGCLHQSGLMAGIALNKLSRWQYAMQEDNDKAFKLGERLKEATSLIYPVETNMVFIEVSNAAKVVAKLADEGVLALAWKPTQIRLICSNLVSHRDVDMAADIIIKCLCD